jgi:hypothetical protein
MKDKMKTCQMTDQIMDWLDGSLDPSQAAAFRDHLRDCPQCRKEMETMRSVRDLLAGRKRPAPSKEILRAYESRLRETFPVPSIWSRWTRKIKLPAPGWLPNPYRGLAGALAILLIGIVIGRFALRPGVSGTAGTEVSAESAALQSDQQQINQFLTQSEIWLIEMASSPANGSGSLVDLRTNREIAGTLLAKTLFMERKAENLNHDVLIDFLNRLEMVLLETSGVEDDELGHAFEEIRQTIRETALLHEIRKIRHSIQVRPGEEA